ncbi:hypothetical protein KGY14_05200 [Ameyamaea chiangmaiensis]|uniref:Uncharacterized protein n=1 Tax=Ameyamaea chiangmaiensis TaxID=442969 RepID=A0A850PE61_9PROT|nr:hypothetical protein [Ameyamaea chiangmaiensis]MBS4074585.1 hypothetical protein [Ameyamaea chiangmaiensis]NVN39341.1 hypothetical protein [Ameyamaea chiangmaiensis]
MQVNELEKARQAASQAGQTAAKNISAGGSAAQDYYNPYVAVGTNYLGSMSNNQAYNSNDTSYIDKAENALNQTTLEQTPGYQWNLSQGEQAATNSAAARGLANSGAALKGASTYASGLADSTYQNQFNDQLSANSSAQGNLTNEFNRQNALLGYGSQAAGASAANALNTATASNQALMEGATGSVAATSGIGNALSGGASALGNTATTYAAYNRLLGNSGASTSPSASSSSGASNWDNYLNAGYS